jgi:hypothetical protein
MADDVLGTGLPELDKILSGEGALRRDELSVFVAVPPTYKTDLWRRQLEHAVKNGGTGVYFDFEMAERPGTYEQLLGRDDPDDPDDPITP